MGIRERISNWFKPKETPESCLKAMPGPLPDLLGVDELDEQDLLEYQMSRDVNMMWYGAQCQVAKKRDSVLDRIAKAIAP